MMSFLAAQRGPISALLGGLGLLVLALVLLQRSVRRAGGWRVVRRRFAREVRQTAAAFARPVRRWWRYRRRLQLLRRLLADPRTWSTVETALRAVPAPGRQPYAAVIAGGAVGVYLTGTPGTAPDDPAWTVDEDDPLLWWTPFDPTAAGATGPVLVAAGVEDTRGGAVFLDLAAGPATHATTGDERTALALVQSVAAQLEVRQPDGTVTIGPGVHPRFEGATTTTATEFLICAGAPDAARPDLRTVQLGGARGHARLLDADRAGLIRPFGTPLVLDVTPLPRSVARTLATIPPAPRRPAAGPALDEDAFLASLDNLPPRRTTPATPTEDAAEAAETAEERRRPRRPPTPRRPSRAPTGPRPHRPRKRRPPPPGRGPPTPARPPSAGPARTSSTSPNPPRSASPPAPGKPPGGHERRTVVNLTLSTVDGIDGTRRDHLVELPSGCTVAELSAALDRPADDDGPGRFLAGAGPARKVYLDGAEVPLTAAVHGSGIRSGTVLGLGRPVRRRDQVRVASPDAGPVLAEVHVVSGPAPGAASCSPRAAGRSAPPSTARSASTGPTHRPAGSG